MRWVKKEDGNVEDTAGKVVYNIDNVIKVSNHYQDSVDELGKENYNMYCLLENISYELATIDGLDLFDGEEFIKVLDFVKLVNEIDEVLGKKTNNENDDKCECKKREDMLNLNSEYYKAMEIKHSKIDIFMLGLSLFVVIGFILLIIYWLFKIINVI